MGNRGYTLIELISVLVILIGISLVVSPIILEIIRDYEEESRISAIEEYMDMTYNTVKLYMKEDENLTVDNNLICSLSCNEDCLIDVTIEAQKSNNISKKCTRALTAINEYNGDLVECESIVYNQLEGTLEVIGCHLDGDLENIYSGNNKKGVTKDNSK